ncbi:MAG: hypothetical protein JRJ66_05585 [Deltaproteobacteria bacterium]|nr:hypothetical protein [Deltaproteobacteria bacterium]MBW2044338.1 hypothetical protein [Deltaproteobacteria bacterium]MBW2301277.1 hypothetical protein [Deltaproteobacteria bacterium]
MNHCIATELLLDGDRYAGAVAFSQKEGQFIGTLAKAILLATGSNGSETLRSVGGILRNRDIDPLKKRYAPKMKALAPRILLPGPLRRKFEKAGAF